MYAALSSKLSTATLRIAPHHRVADAKPRTAVIECAHKKGTGSVKNGRDGNAKYLGVKKYGEEKVTTGCIIVRQRGNKVRAMWLLCVSSVVSSFAVQGGAARLARAARALDKPRAREVCSRSRLASARSASHRARVRCHVVIIVCVSSFFD